jgi:hypothetical protein
MVTWACFAPAARAATVFAVAKPKSLWQWMLRGAFRDVERSLKISVVLSGTSRPTVSQKHNLSAPASMPSAYRAFKNSRSAREASSPLSSTMRPWSLAYSVISAAICLTVSLSFLILVLMCRSETGDTRCMESTLQSRAWSTSDLTILQ